MRRLEHGFCGYRVPVVPRASRSARGRGPIRKKCEDNQIRAFEILASVAGTVLQETENSVSTNAACVKNPLHVLNANSKRGIECEGRSLKEDARGQGNCDEKSFACVPGLQEHPESYTLNEFSHVQDNQILEVGSASNTCDESEMICFTKKLATVSIKSNCGSSSSRVVGHSLSFGEFSEEKVEAEPHKSRSEISGILPVADSSEDLMELDRESLALVGPESDAKVSLLRDFIDVGTFPRCYDNVKVVSRDDDENSVGCTQPSTISKSYRPPPDIGERRIKKLSASRHGRESQKFKDGKMKQMCCNKRYSHIDDRSQKIYPFKKRKFFSQSPLCTSDEVFHHEGVSDFPDKRNSDNHSAATGASSSVTGQVPPASKGCNVKLSIKSFKVPELFIEIPATATVGLLKRTVMESVTAVLGDGLHVGILLQGKKVRDDSKTLLQTGISQDHKRHNLGFILEPRHEQSNPPSSSEDSSLFSGGTGTPQELSRHSGTSLSNLGSCGESKLNTIPSLADISTGNTLAETQALVAVPAIGMEALAVIPFHRKSHPEFTQRRIRRPFSVSEVEALVQAVEKLGTGRWRDVKLRAFDSAKHRTYVDLKDKWKTLVHTARISPQQRRGEPVPQELLDRVLAAHAYWLQHQTRQQVNNNNDVKD
ncbi:telomere repeat-binding protein 5-like isoform X2 [Corylus avellana]|uniref:telomere repeat-binding protein 5-like isoform X2 n=1 Tax=Corylus avellana TaxID=13451 RepID=UPI00286D5029|nr:telomere repeat-binding protein 5-like isoform X2 [Corylus avellana]